MSPVSVRCSGRDADGNCIRTATKGNPRPGWIVVTTYALFEGDEFVEPTRHYLCDRCAVRLRRRFQ